MRGRYAALAVLALGAGLAVGIAGERFWLSRPGSAADDGPRILYWVAPMDPNFRRDGPGKSPMGMDLVPVYEGAEPAGDAQEVELSAAEINAIGVRTAVARLEPIARRIETVGFVGYDGHLTSHVHTRVEGWIEELAVRAVGDEVQRGDLLFTLYAPQIAIGSAELQAGVRRADATEIRTARRKLRNFGMTEAQIEEIAASRAPVDHLRVYAPQDGVVIALDAADGMYLEPDVQALSLTDLSSVWLLVDVFERDIGRLGLEKRAFARFEHLPGRVFEGAIDYIYPELDATTRTLPVRLRFDNAEGLLRPNMYATVALVPPASHEAVTVPSEAVIRTGRAERVVIRTGEGTFRPRLVTTGLRDGFGADGRTEVVQGLAPGEEIVASAHFLIDSESALAAGFLRMAPTEEEPAAGQGELVALDAARSEASIRHERIEALGWPALETRFVVRSDVALDGLAPGDAVTFEAVRGTDGLLALTALDTDDGVDATGTGVVHAITPDGELILSHDPIPALGWPAMRMDMPVAGFDPESIPLEVPIIFDLAEGEDGLFTIVAVHTEDGETADPAPAPAPPVTVDGRIETVDETAGTATIAHGAIREIGMPGMTMDFAVSDDLDPSSLPVGVDARLTFERPDGLTMVLAAVEAEVPPMRVTGRINSVDAAARTANVTHGPLAAIGMPGMTMDFALAPELVPEDLPVGRDVELLLAQGDDFSLTLVGVEAGAAP